MFIFSLLLCLRINVRLYGQCSLVTHRDPSNPDPMKTRALHWGRMFAHRYRRWPPSYRIDRPAPGFVFVRTGTARPFAGQCVAIGDLRAACRLRPSVFPTIYQCRSPINDLFPSWLYSRFLHVHHSVPDSCRFLPVVRSPVNGRATPFCSALVNLCVVCFLSSDHCRQMLDQLRLYPLRPLRRLVCLRLRGAQTRTRGLLIAGQWSNCRPSTIKRTWDNSIGPLLVTSGRESCKRCTVCP